MTIINTAATAALSMANQAGINPMIDIPGPIAIPGMDEPMRLFMGYAIWGGLALVVLAIIAGIVVLCGLWLFGWNMTKRALIITFGSIIGGFLLGGISSVVSVFVVGI